MIERQNCLFRPWRIKNQFLTVDSFLVVKIKEHSVNTEVFPGVRRDFSRILGAITEKDSNIVLNQINSVENSTRFGSKRLRSTSHLLCAL